MNSEAIYQALFDQLSNINGMVTVSRRLRHFNHVVNEQRPALFITQGNQDENGRLYEIGSERNDVGNRSRSAPHTCQHADQHGTRDFQTVQNHDQQKAQHRHDDLRLVHIAHGHIGIGVSSNHASGLERNQRQEQAQTHGDRDAYGLRYAFDNQLSQAEQSTDQE